MKKKIIFIILVLIVVSGTGFYIRGKILKTNNKNQEIISETSQSSSSQSSKNVVNIGGVTIEGDTKGVKIEPVEIKSNKLLLNIPTPNLDREIKITAEMSEDTKKIVTAKIQDLSSQLKKDSNNMENWLVLGVYLKTIGDYEGAKKVWEYIAIISPKNATSFNNLGELYAYYFKDNVKAEKNYAKAIENDPSAIYIYRNFFDFYRYVTKDPAKARVLLEKGIAANPTTSSDLENLLETLK